MFTKKINKKIIKYLNQNCVFNPPVDLNSLKTISINSGEFIFDDLLYYERVNFTNVFNVKNYQLKF